MQTISFNENDEMAGTLSISIQGTDADAGETMTFSLATNPMTLFELTTTATASTFSHSYCETCYRQYFGF